MIFRWSRRFLKSKLKKYPRAYRVYETLSWALARSAFGWTARRFFPRVANSVFPMWIGPRLRLARYLAENGKVAEAIDIADDIMARKPDFGDVRLYLVGSIYSLQGRYEDAYRLFECMEAYRHEKARELQYDRLGLPLIFRKSVISACSIDISRPNSWA
jgi:tetratricopeptide (TPR) repeat protein